MNQKTWLAYQHLFGCDWCGRRRNDESQEGWTQFDFRVYCPSCSVADIKMKEAS